MQISIKARNENLGTVNFTERILMDYSSYFCQTIITGQLSKETIDLPGGHCANSIIQPPLDPITLCHCLVTASLPPAVFK